MAKKYCKYLAGSLFSFQNLCIQLYIGAYQCISLAVILKILLCMPFLLMFSQDPKRAGYNLKRAPFQAAFHLICHAGTIPLILSYANLS